MHAFLNLVACIFIQIRLHKENFCRLGQPNAKGGGEEVGTSWVFGLFIFSISRGFPTKLSKCIDVVVVLV